MREGDGTIYRSSGFPPGVSRLGVTKKQRMGAPWTKTDLNLTPLAWDGLRTLIRFVFVLR